MHLGAVSKLRIPVTPPLRCEIEDIPDGTQQIEAALLDITGHPRMGAIEVTNGAVTVPREDRDCRVLIPLAVFAAKIVLERTGAATQETQVIPASCASIWPSLLRLILPPCERTLGVATMFRTASRSSGFVVMVFSCV
jgi:hypothetical protein